MKLKPLVIGGLWTTYGAIAGKLLSLTSNLFLARLLLPSEFGIISIVYIFWGLMNLFSVAGSFIVHKGTEDKRYLNTTYTISLITAIVLAVGLLLLSPFISSFFKLPDLIWILPVYCINLLFSFSQSVYVGFLTRQMQYRELANVNLVSSLTRLCLTVTFASLGFGYWCFVIGDTVYWIISWSLSRHCTKHNFRLQIDPEVRSEILSYCTGAAGFSFGFYINSNCDNLTIGKLLGSTSLGYYNFAYQITMALTNLLGGVFDQLAGPAFARLQNDKEQENALASSVKQTAFLVAPIYALFFLLVDQRTITLIFGAKWLPACAVIPWLLIFGYFRLINGFLSSMLFAKGQPGVNAKINLHIAPIAVLSFLLGAWQGGILGVSISVTLTLGIGWTIYWWWAGCRELKWSLHKFLAPSFHAALLTLASILISVNTPLMLKPLIFTFSYCALIRLTASELFLQYFSFISKIMRKMASHNG